jgi:hypothetical protein
VVLTEQAVELGNLTKQVLEGVVLTVPDGDKLQHQFQIRAPVLGYQTTVLRATSEPGSGPVTVTGRYVKEPQVCQSLDELTAALRAIFRSDEVRTLVRELYAESQAKGLPYFLVEQNEWAGDASTKEAARERALRQVSQDDEIEVRELKTGAIVGHARWFGTKEPVFVWAATPPSVAPSTPATPDTATAPAAPKNSPAASSRPAGDTE